MEMLAFGAEMSENSGPELKKDIFAYSLVCSMSPAICQHWMHGSARFVDITLARRL